MYAVVVDKTTNNITKVYPCSLNEYTSSVRELSSDTLEYLWLDHSAFKGIDIGDFLSRPYNYSVLVGHLPTDNKLIPLARGDAQIQSISIPDGLTSTTITIPSWAKYLAIEYLIAPGGYGDVVTGGCGAYVTSTVVELNGNRTLYLDLGKAGTKDHPDGTPLSLYIDGYPMYILSGGVGGVSPVDTSTQTKYDPVAGSGGDWVVTIGGPTFNGDSRSTSSIISGYGGGGSNGDGQPGYARIHLSDMIPNIDGPIVDVDVLPSLPNGQVVYTDSGILHDNDTFLIPTGVNYICVSYACAGGGYGNTVTGGQGSYILGTWWRVYPGDVIQATVGKGGSVTGSAGGDTSLTCTYSTTVNTLIHLEGGKSDGTGGRVMSASGPNFYDGKTSSDRSPIGINGDYGYGGDSGHNGGDGILSYTLSTIPPYSVAIYDSRQTPEYTLLP